MKNPFSMLQKIDDLKKLDGKAPYDGGSNICRDDAYFAHSLESKYGKSIKELRREVE